MDVGGLHIPDNEFKNLLERYSVKELSVFGSRARGDNRPDSDIDFLVDFLPASKIDLFDFVELKLALEKLLGISVDLVERDALKPRARKDVLSDARPVYAI